MSSRSSGSLSVGSVSAPSESMVKRLRRRSSPSLMLPEQQEVATLSPFKTSIAPSPPASARVAPASTAATASAPRWERTALSLPPTTRGAEASRLCFR
ncbi:hypothetical protein SO694_0002701 [Aureococcus anophagefferens]|uniref:Uncharacterized protein n=1 Tax=Aureococcus anophagefferens TaxID=44056 RepID=A0ABR1FUW0_AURAN